MKSFQNNNDDVFHIDEALETFSKDQITLMWKHLSRFCALALQESNFEEEESQPEVWIVITFFIFFEYGHTLSSKVTFGTCSVLADHFIANENVCAAVVFILI